MFKRRHLWKWIVLFSVSGTAAVDVWVVFLKKEPHIQWIGPKNQTVRDMLSWLDTPIDMAEFQHPRNLKDTLEMMYERRADRSREFAILVDKEAFREENLEGEIYEFQIEFPAGSRQMSLRQFLSTTLQQIPSTNATILLHHHGFLEVTTLKHARRRREWYHRETNISILDRLRQGCSEILGGEGHLPIPSGGNPDAAQEEAA